MGYVLIRRFTYTFFKFSQKVLLATKHQVCQGFYGNGIADIALYVVINLCEIRLSKFGISRRMAFDVFIV